MRWLFFTCLLAVSFCFSHYTVGAEETEALAPDDELVLRGVEDTAESSATFEDEDWGDGLKVLVTYRPENCEHKAKTGDVIHYHYVGRLGSNGKEFGKSFDYDSPYIVSLGHGRIIPGMDRGLMGTCLWERRRITIPSHLGYGERGIGDTIPSNSVLVFYIRMIKIERNGFALGQDEKFEDMYNTGLYGYTDQKWNLTVDMMEESIRMFNQYENQVLICLKECNGIVDLSKSRQEVVADYAGDDVHLINQFLVYAAKGKCLRECKARSLPPNMRYPDPSILREFQRRKPYSYLHFAYYQLQNYEEGAKCCFTYYHYNPTDEIAVQSLPFYRKSLDLANNQFVSREPIISPNQKSFLLGRTAYTNELWLEATDHFERALKLYKEELSDCQLLCEDVLAVNLTQPDMNEQKRVLLEEYSLVPDTMEYYQLMATIIQDVLECRVACVDRVATMEGQLTDNYLPLILDFLQFSYFKLKQFKKAAECVSTFIKIEPSNQVMTRNIRYYKTDHKVPTEFFNPREELVAINEKLETEKRLLHFAKFGEVKKRNGQRGDKAEIQLPARRIEL